MTAYDDGTGLKTGTTGAVQRTAQAANTNKTDTTAIRHWLARGLNQPGGKLPLFDEDGQSVEAGLVKASIERGWAEPWFANPLKPDWLVCKLTDAGREFVAGSD